jgi:predicted metalloprotease with PDZ domain
LRVTASNLDALLQRYRHGDAVTVHAFRRDELMSFRAVLQPESAPQLRLQTKDKPAAGVKLRQAWLRARG